VLKAEGVYRLSRVGMLGCCFKCVDGTYMISMSMVVQGSYIHLALKNRVEQVLLL
jgi:hypothetical protein